MMPMDDLPEPLFESSVEGARLCLVCTKRSATGALWTVSRPVVPLCDDCRADWNFYGYQILKRVRPTRLIWGIAKYKMLHPLQGPGLTAIWRDVCGLQEWAIKMKRFM
jgi:hypothetical protein